MHVQIWLKVAVKLRKKNCGKIPTTESGTLKGSWQEEFQGDVGELL